MIDHQELYPGFIHLPGDETPDPFRPFTGADAQRPWLLDFHWPRGLTPMAFSLAEDFSLTSQLAAEGLPLATGRGFAQRAVGTHLYFSEIKVADAGEIEARSRRSARAVAAFTADFAGNWGRRLAELRRSLAYFEASGLQGATIAELGTRLREARAFHRRAWAIHFEVMYPLLLHCLDFQRLCDDLGLGREQVVTYLQGYDNKILETDRRLWDLARDARRAGLAGLFARTEPHRLGVELRRAGGAAATWLSRLDDFLDTWGHRTEGTSDVNLATWHEDPLPVLGTIKTFLLKPEGFDLSAAQRRAAADREEAVELARRRLTRARRLDFDAALASCRQANFVWWNDEHNFWIDLRVAVPMREACLAVGDALGTDRRDDPLYLFWPELVDVVEGRTAWRDMAVIVEARRVHYQRWLDRRPRMPKALGTTPEKADDPVIQEIFGVREGLLHAAAGSAGSRVLAGLSASPGVVRGTAHVLHDADELHRIAPGEILVCEATSPNWTPAFGKIAACVTDLGGILSHSAIVSREYGVACVVGVGVATQVIRSGDLIEVDGDRGHVRILRGAAR
ncbi:PEP-utilizing protein mobile subunit [Herbidospora sp. NEAU-GS84]|uniref:PEP-utilizing protein mobile subunit n=1 Tax=Herbidospora solisilvae TaxID=2696284 RepID=A0A7C9JIQ8_9ACTN|nr:PEP-utilizing enzyme [Herbidospora solisilvae]NAS25943.1 PEP-utilizing protein mobile subunit [Herbidospora solisilvae]